MATIPEWMARESAKRLRNWDRAEQWRVLQQTIAWAERQATVQRNTPAACLREQQRKLAQMRTHQPSQLVGPPAASRVENDRQTKDQSCGVRS